MAQLDDDALEKQREEEAWNKLVDEVDRYSEASNENYCEAEIVRLAMGGDEGLTRLMSESTFRKLLFQEELNPLDRLWLHHLLIKVQYSSNVARALCDTRRGAAKNGAKGLRVAWLVSMEVFDHKAPSIEAAWAAVAEKEHLSESMVKKHWVKWKSMVLRGIEVDETPDTEAALKAKLALNRVNQKTD